MRQLRSILALPFPVAVIVPGLLVWWRGEPYLGESPVAQAAGGFLILIGLVFVVWTTLLFATRGRGTLAPWDPPEKLVVAGPYLFVRNPMITGVTAIVAGEALLFSSVPIGAWAMVFVFANAVYIPLKEEPALLARFGGDYARYVRHVPAFVPRATGWDGTESPAQRRGTETMPLVEVPAEQAGGILTLYVASVLALLIFVAFVAWTAIGDAPGPQWLLVVGTVAWALLDLRDARIDAVRPPPPLQLVGRMHEDGKTFELREAPEGEPVGGWRFVRRENGQFILMRPRIASRALVKRHRPAAVPFRMATLYAPRGKPDAEGWVRYPASATFDEPPGKWSPVKGK